jgi:CHAT domain-containing protein/Flp pilus assembly protein TadD
VVLGQEIPIRSPSYWNELGMEYYKQGDYAQAETYWLESKAILEAVVGKEHPEYITTLNNLGTLYYTLRNFKQAEAYFLDLISIAEKVMGKEHPNYAALLNSMGLMYETMNNYTQAEVYLLEAKAIREKVLGKKHPDYALLMNDLGMLYERLGNYNQAETCYLELREIVYYWNDLGFTYHNQGNFDKAIESFLKAKDIYGRTVSKEDFNYALFLKNLGMLYTKLGDYAQEAAYFLEAKDLYERTVGKEHPDYDALLNNLGTAYMYLGDYTKSKSYYLETKDLYERTMGKENSDYAALLNNLGTLYQKFGDYAQSEVYFLEAKDLFERIIGKENSDYVGLLNNFGALYLDLGNYIQSEVYFLEAKAIIEKVQGKENLAYITSIDNLGQVYLFRGNNVQAEAYLLESKAITEKVFGEDSRYYAISLNNLGSLYQITGNYTQSEIYMLETKAILEAVVGKEHPEYATSLNNLGMLYLKLGNYTQSEINMLEAKTIMEKILGKENPEYISSLNNLSSLFLTTKNYTQAIAFKQDAYQLNTGIINRNLSFLSEQQRSNYWGEKKMSFEASYTLSYVYPVPESNSLNYNNALFSKSLLLRTTNALRDVIYASENLELITSFEKLGQLREEISILRRSEKGNQSIIENKEQEAEALDKYLVQSSPEFREFQADSQMNWQDVRESLLSNEAAIEFVAFRIYDQQWTNRTQYAALVLRSDADAPLWVPLCEETVLIALFDQTAALATEAQIQNLYEKNGQTLYAAIWQPLEEVLEGVDTVYYAPAGQLHKISFDAIPYSGKSTLMDKYFMNLVSSTKEIVAQYKRAEYRKPGSAVVYGGIQYNLGADVMKKEALAYAVPEIRGPMNAVIHEDISTGLVRTMWLPLRGSGNEILRIQRELTNNNIEVSRYNGPAGNEESFKNLSGKKTSIIHMATHGFFLDDLEEDNEDREIFMRLGGGVESGQRQFANTLLRSGLVLAGGNNAWGNRSIAGVEDGLLLADEVSRMNLVGTELVVLSACESALGRMDNSEGVFGMQRAFKLAGAQTLVMSLWAVDDQATSDLMVWFYQNWLNGMSKQEAMKTAQRQLRSDPRYASPYYWAAFVLMD